MSTQERYLPIDEEGYFVFDGRRVDDESLGRSLIENIKPVEHDRLKTSLTDQDSWVEAFDAPYIVRHVHRPASGWCQVDLPYRTSARFLLSTLSVDEWDRFHGVMENGVPFVFSRTAQIEFFDFLDSFDDDSVTIDDFRYMTPAWLGPHPEGNESSFWTNIYKTEAPSWDLHRETPILAAVLPQLKLNKARVLILGCGAGHDAAYLASQGHMVTAVDFSDEALRQAREKYSQFETLKFVKADIFDLPREFLGRFDLVFEHTCYCAISPDRRSELVDVWKRCLTPQGDILGVFFVNEKRVGPYFGGSEWEVRERLKNTFSPIFWTRWRLSEESRRSKELVVFARRKI